MPEKLTQSQLEALKGKRLGPYKAFNPVNRVQIWQWCSAMGDANPLYLDDTYRASTEFDRVVAPPAMMQMWTMRDFNDHYAPGSTEDAPYQVFDDLAGMGYPSNIAVSYDLVFERYVLEGEHVEHFTTVVTISEQKTTTLGVGYFVTERVEYLGDGRLFAEALITYFQYAAASPLDPDTIGSPPSGERDSPVFSTEHLDGIEPSPMVSRIRTSGDVECGQALPKLVVPITHRLVVGGALATQDFIPVHHNVPAARAAGMADIFMNILTTNGLSARYLSDWAGPHSRLRAMKFRLMAPNYPGDTMVFAGEVKEIAPGDSRTAVTVDFSGNNSLGTHVAGNAILDLPN